MKRPNAILLGAAIAIGLAVRFYASTLHGFVADEGIHFFTAHRSRIFEVYRASLDTAHPPLFFIVLHFWLTLGTGEIFSRFLSVLLGTAVIPIGYFWSRRILPETGSLAMLILLTFSPPLIQLSAVVRGYTLLMLLLFACLWTTERAFEKRSIQWLLASCGALYGAILTQYSAFLFACALGVYGILRMFSEPYPLRFRLSWAAIQSGVVLIFAVLFYTHIRFWHGSPMELDAESGWLSSQYFNPGTRSAVSFVLHALNSVLIYLIGKLFGVAPILLIAGSILLIKQESKSRFLGIATLFAFSLAAAVSVARLYPFGGSRHSVYLLPFAVLPVAAIIARISRARRKTALVTAILFSAFYFDPFALALHLHARPVAVTTKKMQTILTEIQKIVPRGSVVLADGNTQMLLSYYWGKNAFEKGGKQIGRYSEFDYQGYRILSGMKWSARSEDIKAILKELQQAGISVAWIVDLCDSSSSVGANNDSKIFGKQWKLSPDAVVIQLMASKRTP